MAITSIKIFPSIGIARLGNSPADYFIGPEIPGVPAAPTGGYRDGACRIKRQAARFRIFGYDGSTLVKEITAADAQITWTVHLANKKASWTVFNGTAPTSTLRNSTVSDRASLEIDPGPRTLSAPNQEAAFNTGRFRGLPVPLGEMRTEADGRLLVLGGFGRSGAVPASAAPANFANNDNWFDDVSDGPVTATVSGLAGSSGPLVAAPAWVICPPPDFAPPVESITSLYDVLFQVAVTKGWLTVTTSPSFTADVYPILRRVLDLQRTNQRIGPPHHVGFTSAFGPGVSAATRQAIVGRVRDPNNPTAAGSATMPLLWDDNNAAGRQTITKSQYAILAAWRDGTFADDWPGAPPTPETTITPDGLTRAALEACAGGAFYPGIEASWFVRDTYSYSEPFRLSHTGRSPGDVTKQMAVPWQADFRECYDYGGYAWWPAQRPDEVYPEAGGGPVEWIRDIVSSKQDMVDHWHKLGFVVKKGGALVETERRKICSHLFMITDRSEFSLDEVTAVLTAGAPAVFSSAVYVVADGYLPAELSVTTAIPTPAQLKAWAPQLTFVRPGTAVTQLSGRPVALLLQDNTLPASSRQRFTFVYDLEFAGTADFMIGGVPQELQQVGVTATKGTDTTSGMLRLTNQPNPYFVDGATSWLSTDLRVFQLTEGQTRFGYTLGGDSAAAVSFIGKVVNKFRGLPVGGHPFATLAEDPVASRLELAEKVGGKKVFNFAVARVRYKGQALTANDVRVFFRLFTTAATGVEYDESTYPRTPSARALLGVQGGRLVTIPCLGVARDDTATVPMGTTEDTLNLATLTPAGATETVTYFGAWLDFNQTTLRFPVNPGSTSGPWTSSLKSIQELIRGMHQCLVAEIYFGGNPIPAGATPANNDNLAQRNLVIDESANPGTPPTRTVAHTFEIKAPRPAEPNTFTQELPTGRDDHREYGLALAAVQPVEYPPDELLIRMDGLPYGADVRLYLPDVDVDAVLRIAGQRYECVGIERVDPHTLRCLPGGACYVPVPEGRTSNIPGLLTVALPKGVRHGQMFNVVVHQLTGAPRRVLGSFQFAIPVSSSRRLLTEQRRSLSVLRHIQRRLEPEDAWRAVFNRYLGLVADRVDGFGGNASRVEPSPTGSGVDEATVPCRRRAGLVAALIAVLVAVFALHPLAAYLAEALVATILLITLERWRRACAPERCVAVMTAFAGLTVGAGLAALAWLASLAGLIALSSGRVAGVLATVGLCLSVSVTAAIRWRCLPTFRGTDDE